MKGVLHAISYAGVQEGMPEKTVEKYVLTNRAILILFLGNLQYVVLALTDYPQLRFLVFIAPVVQLIAFGLNLAQLLTASRLLIILFTAFNTALTHLYILQPGESPLLGFTTMAFVFFLLPWLLMDFRQRKTIILSSLWIFGCILIPFLADGQNTEGFDTSRFKEGFDLYMSLTINAAGFIIGSYLIQQINSREVSKNQQLVQEVEEKNSAMEQDAEKLNEYIREVKNSQEKDRRRQWASEHLNTITSIIRSNTGRQQTYDQLITQTVKAVQANQGALYTIEKDKGHEFLEMKACYAYDKKKYIDKRIEFGQGLVGQCFLEQEYIYMTEIPQGYVYITSGLGEATPNALILIPMIYNEKVVGVLELASFNKFEEHQIDFLNQLGATVASFVLNLNINEMTRRLLEESQQQAEQLQANEEELRQNMEEMNATQEELQREIAYYKKQLEEKDRLLHA